MTCDYPCNCFNDSTYTPCTENLTCCEHCDGGAPCAYAILFKCEHGHALDDVGRVTCPQGIVARHITMLWKDCLFNCKWSARIGLGVGFDGNSCDVGSLICFDDLDFPGNPSNYPCGCDRCLPSGYVDNSVCDDPCVRPYTPFCEDNYLRPMEFGCGRIPGDVGNSEACGWHDWFGKTYDCDQGPTYWQDFLDNCTAPVWQLEVTGSSSATITANYIPDFTLPVLTAAATYSCDSWDCLGRNTFTLDGTFPNDTVTWLPKHICVVPYSSNLQTPCDTVDDMCACKDAGWNNFCLDLSGFTCGGIQNPTDPLSLVRNAAFTVNGHDVSGSISDPSAPCGYFFGSINSSCNGSDDLYLAFLVYCDGSDYQGKLYCVNAGAVTLVSSVTFTETSYCDDGFRGTIDWGSSATSCCPTCDSGVATDCCPDDPVPSTLYATISAPDCDLASGMTLPPDGMVITLSYIGLSGGIHRWTGPMDLPLPTSPLGPCVEPLTFGFALIDGISCEYFMWIEDGDGNDIWGNSSSAGQGSHSCVFTSATNNTENATVPTCMQRAFAPTCSGAMTATVTP